jgi:hypothetical protein
MRRNKFQFVSTLSVICLMATMLASCNGKGKGIGLLGDPTSSGRPYEVLVVADTGFWDRPAGTALYDLLNSSVPGLPQQEPQFDVSRIDPPHYRTTFKMFRNIITLDINGNFYTQTRLKYRYDEYAYPQAILEIHTPSEGELATFLKYHGQEIINFFVKVEMNREAKELEEKHSQLVTDMAKQMFGCKFFAPREIKSKKKGKNFFWASSNTGNASLNVCMYAYPYPGPAAFTKAYFVHQRDSFMRANIPGEEPNMFMKTDTFGLDVHNVVVKRSFAQEARGLWEMENDAMGGPFVSHARVDTVRNRVVVVEGFVYAPDKTKRNWMRRLEASLYTLDLPARSRKVQREVHVSMPSVSVSVKKTK